jgi:phage terminase small subunit
MALTLKQKTFIQEYLLSCGNATEAAMGAYRVKNRQTASQIGYENLRKPEVKNELTKALSSKHMDYDWCIERMKEIIISGSQRQDISTHDVLGALELYFKVKGYLAPQGEVVGSD